MAGFRGLFVRKDATKGTTPIEGRKSLAGLVAPVGSFGGRPGVLSGGAMSGTTGWGYSFAAGNFVTSRSVADGVVIWGNDAAVTITCSAAPASNSRIDIGWALHNDVDAGDADSAATFGVASGTAAAIPVAPSIPAGAIELGRATLSSGAANTQAAVFSTTFVQYTASRGAPIPVTGATQQAAVPASATSPGLVYRIDTGQVLINRGAGWATLAQGAWTSFPPPFSATITAPNLGGGAVREGEFTVVDKTCTYRFNIQFGTAASTAGSGTYTVGLPLPAAAVGAGRIYGMIYGGDSSAGTTGGKVFAVRASGTDSTLVVLALATSATQLVSDALPHVWAENDFMRGTFTYAIA